MYTAETKSFHSRVSEEILWGMDAEKKVSVTPKRKKWIVDTWDEWVY